MTQGVHGVGIGRGQTARPKRHQKILRDNILGITRPAIRRLARRGGVKRMSASIYGDIRQTVHDRLKLIVHELVLVASYSKRKTIMTSDVVYVLRKQGRTMYGFDDILSKRNRR